MSLSPEVAATFRGLLGQVQTRSTEEAELLVKCHTELDRESPIVVAEPE